MKRLKNKYLVATALYTFGSFFNKAISLLLLPIFTRMLSKSSYGIVSTYNSWVNIVVVLIGMQLNLSLRMAYTDYKEELKDYIHSINLLTSIISGGAMLVACIICHYFFNDVVMTLVICCILQSFMTAIINIQLQKQMMALEYAKRTVLLSAPNVIAAIIGIAVISLYPESDFWGRILSMVMVYVFIGGYYLVKYKSKKKNKEYREYWHYAMAFSAPLIFHGLANVLLSNIDVTMLTWFRSAAEAGVYSIAHTMGMVLIAVTSALESVWIPWFTKNMDERKTDEVNRIGKLYISVGALICIGAVLCMPEVLKLFSDREYWDAVNILPLIILASYIVFLFTICANTEYYYKKTKHIAVNTVIAAVTNVVLNAILIPIYGAIAAAFTTLISYSVSFVLHYIYSRKLDKKILGINLFILPTVFVVTGTVISYLCMEQPIVRWSLAICLVVFASLLSFKYKKKLFP